MSNQQTQQTIFGGTGSEPSQREKEAVLDYFGGLKHPIGRRHLERFARRSFSFWTRNTLDRFEAAKALIECGKSRPTAALARAFRRD